MQQIAVPEHIIMKSENQDLHLSCLNRRHTYAINKKNNTHNGGFLNFTHENSEGEFKQKGKKCFSNHKSAVSSNSPQTFKMAYTVIVPKLNPELNLQQHKKSNNIIAFSSQQLSSPKKPFTHFIDQSVKRLWTKQCPIMGVQRSKLSRTFSNDQRSKNIQKNTKIREGSPHYLNLKLLNHKIQQKYKNYKIQNQSFTHNATQIITLKSKIRQKRNQLAGIITQGHKQQQKFVNENKNDLSYLKFERQHFKKELDNKQDAFRSTSYSTNADPYLTKTRNFNVKRRKSNFSQGSQKILQIETNEQTKGSLQYFEFVSLMRKLRQVKRNVIVPKIIY